MHIPLFTADRRRRMMRWLVGTAVVGLVAFTITAVSASSHREAPLIAGDPKADATDLYAFRSPDKTDTVTLIANYLPFQEAAGGPNFYTFDPRVRYEINVDNNGDAKADLTYRFVFYTKYETDKTFLYTTGKVNNLFEPTLNVKQAYDLFSVDGHGKQTLVAKNVPVAPSNVGPASMPNYSRLQGQAVKKSTSGITTFAGQSDDPFFVDLGGTFDLLTIRKLPGNAGAGVDGLRGYNVNSLALQIPIAKIKGANSNVIGVWTSAWRRSTRVLSASKGTSNEVGSWVQVSRLGAPLVNEVVIPLGKKDLWNNSQPKNDGQFANYVANPELGGLLKGLYGIAVPPQANFGKTDQRDDLEAIFLTGLKGLNQPRTVTPSEELRLNLSTAVAASPNRMGVLGADTQGYPNGRRLTDDVVDISEQAVAGAAYPLFHPTFTPDPLASKLGDGVDANDVSFRGTFPYLALPHDGVSSMPHQ